MPAIFVSFFGWIVFGFSFSQTSIRIPYGWFGRIMLKLFNILGRYAPEMNPRYMNFTVEGVKLADQKFDCDDTRCSVKLDQLRPQTSGVYKCEVSSDAPHFNLISGTANMSVAGKFVWIVVYVIQKLWLFELVFFFFPFWTHWTAFIHSIPIHSYSNDLFIRGKNIPFPFNNIFFFNLNLYSSSIPYITDLIKSAFFLNRLFKIQIEFYVNRTCDVTDVYTHTYIYMKSTVIMLFDFIDYFLQQCHATIQKYRVSCKATLLVITSMQTVHRINRIHRLI